MAQFFQIHPDNPQERLLKQTITFLETSRSVIVYPTDSCYALGCRLGDKEAMERIRKIRQLDKHHHFTLVCRDLSEISTYAKLGNKAYRLLKKLTPGAYTFILKATHEVPRRLQHSKRKTIGLRIPDNMIVQKLLDFYAKPLLSVTLDLPSEALPLTDPYEIRDILDHQVDLVIDGGYCGYDMTTVIDLTDDYPQVIREGKGCCEFLD